MAQKKDQHYLDLIEGKKGPEAGAVEELLNDRQGLKHELTEAQQEISLLQEKVYSLEALAPSPKEPEPDLPLPTGDSPVLEPREPTKHRPPPGSPRCPRCKSLDPASYNGLTFCAHSFHEAPVQETI